MSIKVSSLSKIYNTQKAVSKVSFSADKGQIIGFLGPNGAGKSTPIVGQGGRHGFADALAILSLSS